MAKRNMEVIRQFENPDNLRALVNLPTTLLVEVQRATKPTLVNARLVQAAVAIALLLQAPVRLKNLRGLRIGVHLVSRPGCRATLSIPSEEIKNGVPFHAELSVDTTKLIDIFIAKFRSLLTPSGGDFLFPGRTADTSMSDDGLRTQITKIVAERIGLRMHPHAFRHFSAFVVLKNDPRAHGTVQRILGHGSMHSTMAFYSGMEAPGALAHYDQLLDAHRPESPQAAAARPQRGAS